MKAIGQLAGRRLRWTQPSGWTRKFQLEADGEPAGSLEFRNLLGSFATGVSGDGSWTFKRTGFIRTRVTIRRSGEDAEVGTFANNTWSGGGTLHLPDGRELRASTNLWQSRMTFETEAGETLLAFRSHGLVHLSADIEVGPSAAEWPELPWIVMLGWYLLVMMKSDSAAAAGGAAS
jgi:hypothetical protein